MKDFIKKSAIIQLLYKYFCYKRCHDGIIVDWEKTYKKDRVCEFMLDYIEHYNPKTMEPSFELFKSIVWEDMVLLKSAVRWKDFVHILKLRIYLYTVWIDPEYHNIDSVFAYPLSIDHELFQNISSSEDHLENFYKKLMSLLQNLKITKNKLYKF